MEELLGMILSHAKTQAETFTEQPIKDAVITVPVFFNQVSPEYPFLPLISLGCS